MKYSVRKAEAKVVVQAITAPDERLYEVVEHGYSSAGAKTEYVIARYGTEKQARDKADAFNRVIGELPPLSTANVPVCNNVPCSLNTQAAVQKDAAEKQWRKLGVIYPKSATYDEHKLYTDDGTYLGTLKSEQIEFAYPYAIGLRPSDLSPVHGTEYFNMTPPKARPSMPVLPPVHPRDSGNGRMTCTHPVIAMCIPADNLSRERQEYGMECKQCSARWNYNYQTMALHLEVK